MSPWSRDAEMIKMWSSTSQPKGRDRYREIAVIMQLSKFRTNMHTGHQEITKETAGSTKVELRAKQTATQGLG